MTTTLENMTCEVATYCTCAQCSECGIIDSGADSCDECSGELATYDYCSGYCWEIQVDEFAYLVDQWIKANEVAQFYLQGSGMGWRRTSSHTGKLETASEALALLTGFDCTLRVTYDVAAKTLEVVRSSHDELGACFEFVACELCWFCGEGMTYDEIECAWTDLGGYTDCGYSPNDKHNTTEILPGE